MFQMVIGGKTSVLTEKPNLTFPSASLSGPSTVIAGRIVPACVLLIFIAQCVWFVRTQSLTFDEPAHIAAGMDACRRGSFELLNDHPPLAHFLYALPLLNPKWHIELEPLPQGFGVPLISPNAISLAWRARMMNVALGVLLGFLIWFEARKHFSLAAANFALTLFAFAPSLIAHFAVATTDGAPTLLIFAAATQVGRWRQEPSWRNTALAGVILGLLLLAKLSTLPMFLLAVVLLLTAGGQHPSLHPGKWNWRKSVAATGLAFFVLWGGYFFHVSRVTIRDGVLTVSHPHWKSSLVKPTRSRLNISIPVPAGEYIAGFREVVFHNAHGHRAFMLGQVSSTGGWKSYYPVTILLKWPVLLLMASLAGLILCFRSRAQLLRDLWIVFLFPTVYLALAISSHFNVGERHILPLYPFALLLTAAFADRLLEKRWGILLVFSILLLNAADCLRYAPGYLSYMNVFVNPATSYRLLSDSNLDWGQGLLAVRKYQEQHPGEALSLAYFGSVAPEVYGVNARRLQEGEHASGTVIVSATELSGQYLHDPGAYQWLLQYKPKQILDHCMYVFAVHP